MCGSEMMKNQNVVVEINKIHSNNETFCQSSFIIF